MPDTDQWQERFSKRLSNHEGRLDDLESFQVEHLTKCHPEILKWQGKMWGKWLAVTGMVGGFCAVIGYVMAHLFPLWGK